MRRNEAIIPLIVLIVEPESVVADLIGEVVKLAGATPVMAYDGCEALSLARTHAPALLVTALLLPSMHGRELIAAIHREWDATLPVILLSGSPHARMEAAGADAMLAKPFRVADLLAVLTRYLAASSADHLKGTVDRPLQEPFEQDEWRTPPAEPHPGPALKTI